MPAVLLTGMAGVGKSTVLAEIERRGIRTVDTDVGDWMRFDDDGERQWRESAIARLLDEPGELVLAGTVPNQVLFYDRLVGVVLLTVPVAVALARIDIRTNNDFGKRPEDRRAVEQHFPEVEPLLRAGATLILDGRRPVGESADAIVAILRGA